MGSQLYKVQQLHQLLGKVMSMRLCLIENFTRHVEHIGVAVARRKKQVKPKMVTDGWMEGMPAHSVISREILAHTYLPPPSTTFNLQFRLS